jgi:glycerophosphoryl diester phosphodiesterase
MLLIWLVICSVLLVIAALFYCIAPGRKTSEATVTAKAIYGRNFAHRGLHTENNEIPENSLSAFALARDKGYGVELDVRLTKDEKVVVFHDENLKRICGVDKMLDELEFDELRELRLNGTEERIPTLTEALEVLGGIPVIVEIKTAGEKNAVICQKTLEIMREGKQVWCVKSFDPRVGRWFRENAGEVLRGQLCSQPGAHETLSKLVVLLLANLMMNYMSRPHFISFSIDPYTPGMKLCKLMKPMIMVWTVRPGHDIAMYEKMNDAIVFEYYQPEQFYKYEKNESKR